MASIEKRAALIEISKIAKARQEDDCEGMSINEILVDQFYTDAVNFEFNTFYQWKAKGMNIKKGSTAFLVWGAKRSSKQNTTEGAEQTDEEKAYNFFPVCYLFSNNQVEQKND